MFLEEHSDQGWSSFKHSLDPFYTATCQACRTLWFGSLFSDPPAPLTYSTIHTTGERSQPCLPSFARQGKRRIRGRSCHCASVRVRLVQEYPKDSSRDFTLTKQQIGILDGEMPLSPGSLLHQSTWSSSMTVSLMERRHQKCTDSISPPVNHWSRTPQKSSKYLN